MFSKCLLRHDVVRVFVSSLVLVFVRAILSCALKHDMSTLFATFFVCTSLQFIFSHIRNSSKPSTVELQWSCRGYVLATRHNSRYIQYTSKTNNRITQFSSLFPCIATHPETKYAHLELN